jgi:hypothetical protein
MPGDYTRFTFAPGEDHIGVLMQQGRVLLDADFNELVEVLERRIRAGTMDTFYRCVVPRTTPDGFLIGLNAGMLTIGQGRIYVDGILAENHGAPATPPAPFDPRLAETTGAGPVRYDQQPYYPVPPALPQGGGPHLVYVDVWQRELTHLEEADLLEKAVGVDSATRLQTVWQVKVLPNVGGGVTCATPADQIPAWVALTAPAAGRLTVRAVGVPAETDPCVVSPAGGYRGTENRLYRVEVHQGGTLGTATFKWSRDNASIAAQVLGMDAARKRLTVSRTARDAVLRFSPDDWVEVIDDRQELKGEPGVLRKVAVVDDVEGIVELAAALPVNTFDPTDATRHTRLRLWDQKGLVRNAANVVVANVDASNGAIPVPAAGDLVLEDGIQLSFGATPASGVFRTGDYWVFAARTVDASVEELTQAPPRGIHHHYCRLAVYTPSSPTGGQTGPQPTDCRALWPPECDCDEGGCDCAACVTAEEHNSGTFTIQMAVDQVKDGEGGKVCLGPGVFFLTEPVRIEGAQSLRLEGRGWRTILVYMATAPEDPTGVPISAQPRAAVEVVGSIGVEVGSLSVFAVAMGNVPVMALLARNVASLVVERCVLVQFGNSDAGGMAVGMDGFLVSAAFRENLVFGTGGFVALSRPQKDNTPQSYTYTAGLYIEDNQILGTMAGIVMAGVVVHLADTRVAGNSVYVSLRGCVVMEGIVASWARVDITGNEIATSGDAISFSTDNTRVAWNDVGELSFAQGGSNDTADGIVIAEPRDDGEVDGAQVIGNRVTGLGGIGIRIQGRVGSAMIKQNVIRETGAGGIVMEEESEAEVLAVENNQLLQLDAPDDQARPYAAIRFVRVARGDVSSNVIGGFAPDSVTNPMIAGIEAVACGALRIAANQVYDIGPAGEFAGDGAGIVVSLDFDRLDVVDNDVRRTQGIDGEPDDSRWVALRIGVTEPPAPGVSTGTFPQVDSQWLESRFVMINRKEMGAKTETAAKAETAARNEAVAGYEIEAIFGDRLVVLAASSGRGYAAVRGNYLESRGGSSAALVRAGINCIFSENRCLQNPVFNPSVVLPAIAVVGAFTVVAGNNYLARPYVDQSGPGLALQVDPKRCTVLGNIVEQGNIQVNGVVLGAPWSALNVVIT